MGSLMTVSWRECVFAGTAGGVAPAQWSMELCLHALIYLSTLPSPPIGSELSASRHPAHQREEPQNRGTPRALQTYSAFLSANESAVGHRGHFGACSCSLASPASAEAELLLLPRSPATPGRANGRSSSKQVARSNPRDSPSSLSLPFPALRGKSAPF